MKAPYTPALRPSLEIIENRVTGAGTVNLNGQRVGSAAEEIDFSIYCPVICHIKPSLYTSQLDTLIRLN